MEKPHYMWTTSFSLALSINALAIVQGEPFLSRDAVMVTVGIVTPAVFMTLLRVVRSSDYMGSVRQQILLPLGIVGFSTGFLWLAILLRIVFPRTPLLLCI